MHPNAIEPVWYLFKNHSIAMFTHKTFKYKQLAVSEDIFHKEDITQDVQINPLKSTKYKQQRATVQQHDELYTGCYIW